MRSFAAFSRARYLRRCSAASSAAAIRASIGARQQWQMASANASAASAGVSAWCSARILVTIAVTCALSAPPLPVTAALTSLGCGSDVDAALGGCERDHSSGLRGTHHRRHVLLGEHPLDGDDVRAVGVHPVLDRVADGQQAVVQRFVGWCADHVDVEHDDLPPFRSITESPQRVSPGSTPITARQPLYVNICSTAA